MIIVPAAKVIWADRKVPMATEMSAFVIPKPVPSITKGTYAPPPTAGEFCGLTLVTVGCAEEPEKHSHHMHIQIETTRLA
jgi:hypothetical protein